MNNKTKTMIALAALVTICMHILNRILHSFATVKKILSSNEGQYYEWRFGKIHYTKKGSGNPILLIHDLSTGSSSYEFKNIKNDLSKNHKVYSLDLLGFGLSDKPNMTYTNYLYVQLVIDFVKNIIGKKVDIIATGDSVPIIVMASHNDPEVFNRLIFINPQSIYKLNQIPSKQTKALKILIDTPILGTFIYNILTRKTFIEKEFLDNYFYNPMNISEENIFAYIEASHSPDYNSKHVFASYIGRYMNTNIIHSLKEINHSIYIIAGKEKEDNKTIIENYEYYNSSIETSFIEKTRQLPHLEKPKDVMQQIFIFLNE